MLWVCDMNLPNSISFTDGQMHSPLMNIENGWWKVLAILNN